MSHALTPASPKFTKLSLDKHEGCNGEVYALSEPITHNGKTVTHVLTSFGLEVVLGEYSNFAVFACSPDGKILDWNAIYSDNEGPSWCVDLI